MNIHLHSCNAATPETEVESSCMTAGLPSAMSRMQNTTWSTKQLHVLLDHPARRLHVTHFTPFIQLAVTTRVGTQTSASSAPVAMRVSCWGSAVETSACAKPVLCCNDASIAGDSCCAGDTPKPVEWTARTHATHRSTQLAIQQQLCV